MKILHKRLKKYKERRVLMFRILGSHSAHFFFFGEMVVVLIKGRKIYKDMIVDYQHQPYNLSQ
jgi:hypothetical protein